MSAEQAMMVTRAGDNTGVAWHRHQLVAAIDVHGPAHVPAVLAGRTLRGAPTIPMGALETELAAIGAGAPTSLDIVLQTRRLTRTPYANAYDTLLSGRPLAGDRRTLAILRFDPSHDPGYWAARPSLPEAAAVIVERLRQTLAMAGCPATALTRQQLAALAAASSTRGVQRWNHLSGQAATRHRLDVYEYDPAAETRWTAVSPPPRETLTTTSYSVDPAALRGERIQELWAIRADAVTLTVRRDHRGGWSAVTAVRAPRPPASPPLPFLRTLPGQQAAAAEAGAALGRPAGLRTVFEALPSLDDDLLACGPDGQILGQTEDGHQLVAPLTPAPRQIVLAHVSNVYAEQLMLRAMACGARVTVITNDARRWHALAGVRVATVAEDLAAEAHDLHVYDRVRPPTDPETASVELTDRIPVNAERRYPLILDQYDDMVAVTRGRDTTLVRAVVDPSERPHLPAAHRTGVLA